MKRMSVLTKVDLESPASSEVLILDGVRLYDIAGPMFFGAAKTAMEQLHDAGTGVHTYILDMARVPTIDATGIVALESVLDTLRRARIKVISRPRARGQRDPRPRRYQALDPAAPSPTRPTCRPRSAWRSCTRQCRHAAHGEVIVSVPR